MSEFVVPHHWSDGQIRVKVLQVRQARYEFKRQANRTSRHFGDRQTVQIGQRWQAEQGIVHVRLEAGTSLRSVSALQASKKAKNSFGHRLSGGLV